MKRSILGPLFLVLVFALVTTNTYAITIKYPYVFISQFPDEAESLGFTKGIILQLGAFVTPGDSPVTEVTAKNLDTGLVLRLTITTTTVGKIFNGMTLYQAWESGKHPAFDPSKQLGVWEIRAKDETGNEVAAKTHRLDKAGEMPYVGNLRASGNPLAPTISWSAPKQGSYPPECIIRYAVRLLKNIDSQFYRSKYISDDTKHQIPEGVLKFDDIPDTYVRVECQCVDQDDKEHRMPVELMSQTFRPLKEALGQLITWNSPPFSYHMCREWAVGNNPITHSFCSNPPGMKRE